MNQPQQRFAVSVAKIGGGAVLAQAVSFAVVPVISRLYVPEVVGVLSVFASTLGILGMMVSGRYELAIPLPAEERDAQSLLLLCLLLTGTSSLATTVVIVLAVSGGVDLSPIGNVVWMLPVAVLGVGVYQALSWWATRIGAFGTIGSTKIAQALSMGATQVGLGMVYPTAWTLVVGHSLGVVAGGRRLFSRSGLSLRRIFRFETRVNLSDVASRYSRFPLYAMPSAGLSVAAATHLPVLLTAYLFGPTASAGLFLAQRVLAAPTLIIGQPAAQVATPAFIAASRVGKLRREVASICWKMVAVSIVIFLPAYFFLPGALPQILGDDWGFASGMVAPLCALYACQLAFLPLMQLFNALEWQRAQLVWSAVRAVAASVGLYIPWRWGLSFNNSLYIYAVLQCVVILLVASYCVICSRDFTQEDNKV